MRKKRLFLNCPCLSPLSAQVAGGEASFAAPGVPQRVVWPLPGDGGTEVGTEPGHAATGGGPACSPWHMPHPHQSPVLDAVLLGPSTPTTSVPLQTPMKSSSQAANTSWFPGFGISPCPLLAMPKGSNPGIKPRLMTPGIWGHRRTQGSGSCMWVTAQSQNSKEPLGGLCQSRGYGKTPGILCSSNTSGIFWPRSGFAVMKRSQCPQGEKEKKEKGEKRKGWSRMKLFRFCDTGVAFDKSSL